MVVVHCELEYQNSEVHGMKLTLDVENTTTTRDGKLHLDPFESENSLDTRGYAE